MQGLRMPPKLADGVRKIAMVAPLQWISKIDAWRRHQPDMPNMSEAIRRLVELGLAAERHGATRLEASGKGKKPKG